MPIALIVHGGAGTIASERIQSARMGCQEATQAGWRILQEGGSAMDAVEAAVRLLEDNPQYNAGTGASLNAEGNIELDAGMMDGATLQVGAVAGVELIKNPISLARKVLESPNVMLVARGAQAFAQAQGISLCKFEDLRTERQYENWMAARSARMQERSLLSEQEKSSVSLREEGHGTVGAVALDMSGKLAAATSTGGMVNKYPGRVGDSPLVGCGFYADENAAVSCTGEGESFVRLLVAKRAADFVERGGTAREAAQSAIAVLGAKTTGVGGLIIVDRFGNIGYARNTQSMACGYMVEGLEEPQTDI